jgi:1-acyl-sn-glycerol-3-phosphate acyltransferase
LAVPIVPAAVNSGVFWGRRSFLKRPGRIVLEFLDPIPPGQPRRQVMAALEQRIETAAAALLREAEAVKPISPVRIPAATMVGRHGGGLR